MDSTNEKVAPLRKEPGSAGGDEMVAKDQAAGRIKARRDIGWLGLIVAFIAILGVGGVYYVLNANQQQIAAQAQSAFAASTEARETSQAVQGSMEDMQARLDELASLPEEIQGLVLQGMVDDLAGRAQVLADKLEGQADAETLQQLHSILGDLRSNLAR